MKTPLQILIFLAFIFFPSLLCAQAPPEPNLEEFAKLSDILPPSPNAASLGRYGGVEVGLVTGTMQHNIPLYTVTSPTLKVPVSLSYSSNGLRVDEVASRVGAGWQLNAGGVITRTVYGAADEGAVRVSAPQSFPQRTQELLDFAEQVSGIDDGTSYDSQPDMFSFNFDGYSGRFLLDEHKAPVLLSHSNLKIQMHLDLEITGFTVTTPEGVSYIFGGEQATEKTRKVQYGGCGRAFPQFTATAWYLRQIVHPSQDIINFSYSPVVFRYTAGISQTRYSYPTLIDDCLNLANAAAFVVSDQRPCFSILETSSPLLNEITFKGGRLAFAYTDRQDVGDRLLASLMLYPAGQAKQPVRVFKLSYMHTVASRYLNAYSTSGLDDYDPSLVHRPFLSALSESGSNGAVLKKHAFRYHGLDNLPPRFSYAQDHYGYFNGQDNQSLFSAPSNLAWREYFPEANANREPSSAASQNGMLAEIIYPTGGYDRISYEGHTVHQLVEETRTPVKVDVPGVGNSTTAQQVKFESGSFHMGFTQQAFFSVYSSVDKRLQDSSTDPEHHQRVLAMLINETNGGKYEIALNPVDHEPSSSHSYGDHRVLAVDLIEGYNYRIELYVSGGVAVSGRAELTYTPGEKTMKLANVSVGGVRVSHVQTLDPVTGQEISKKYLYSALQTPNTSSGSVVAAPRYEQTVIRRASCRDVAPELSEWKGGDCGYSSALLFSLHASSLDNLFIYGSSPVYYSAVVESNGPEFLGGGIERHYKVSPDVPGNIHMGNSIPGAPLSSRSWENGLEYYKKVFKKLDGKFLPVQEVFTHFREDARVDRQFIAYIGYKQFNIHCTYPILDEDQFKAYDLMSYTLHQKWVYADTVRTRHYGTDGVSFTEELVVTGYGNTAHALPTMISTQNSLGKTKQLRIFYPQDIIQDGAAEQARQALVARHILSPALVQEVEEDGNLTRRVKTIYGLFPHESMLAGLVLPRSQHVQVGIGPLEKRVEFFRYNAWGMVEEQGRPGGGMSSYLYDFNSTFPVAGVVNATLSQVAYTSFEADGKGSWNFTGTAIPDSSSPTGDMCYSLQAGELHRTGLTASQTYIVSYWVKGNSPVQVSHSSSTLQGETISGWTRFEHRVTGSTAVTISGGGYIDEVRLLPESAQMTTYTYDPLVGIRSVTDLNGRTAYYEYDELGRLRVIRDHHRQVLQRYDYRYAVQ